MLRDFSFQTSKPTMCSLGWLKLRLKGTLHMVSLLLILKTSLVIIISFFLLSISWEAVTRVCNADGSYKMEKILEFLGSNKFPLITKLTETNTVWVYSSPVKLQVRSFCDYSLYLLPVLILPLFAWDYVLIVILFCSSLVRLCSSPRLMIFRNLLNLLKILQESLNRR